MGLWLCAGLGVACYVTLTRTSHSYAMDAGAALIAADFAHLVAGGVWGGGLVVLAMAMPQVLRHSDEAAVTQTAAALIRKFSPVGMVGVALVSSTGLWLSTYHLSSIDALTNTVYGNLLVLKVIGVMAAVILAGLHKFLVARNLRSRAHAIGFARSLALEAAIVIAVFFVAALLTSAPPAHSMDEN
jgi:putative copper export protein